MIRTMTHTREVTEIREEMFTDLYLECFPGFARYVSKAGGSLDEARDAFQDALLSYYEKLVEGKVSPETNHPAYLVGIAKNLYLKSRRKNSRMEPLQGQEMVEEKVSEPVSERIMLYLRQAGKKCMDLLGAFYYDRLSMEDLADRFGYNSGRSATVGKYKCLEKVRETIKEKSLEYEDFTA